MRLEIQSDVDYALHEFFTINQEPHVLFLGHQVEAECVRVIDLMPENWLASKNQIYSAYTGALETVYDKKFKKSA